MKNYGLTLLFGFLATSFTLFGQDNNTQIKADPRLYDCFDEATILNLEQNKPDKLLFYNYYLDNAWFISDAVSGKPVDDKGINTVTLRNNTTGETIYFTDDPANFDLKNINVLKYNFEPEEDNYVNYVLGDTGKVLVFYPRNKFMKKFEAYKRSLNRL